jgi:hypothetical protein
LIPAFQPHFDLKHLEGSPTQDHNVFSECHRIREEESLMTTTDLRRIWNDSTRLFFAPLVGAVTGAVKEFQRVNREVELNRHRAINQKSG